MKLSINIPQNAGNLSGIKGMLEFLEHDHCLGVSEFSWQCSISKQMVGLRVERTERSKEQYYREPYPLTLTIIAPKIVGFPEVTYPLTPDNAKDLISALSLELRKKWPQ